jgi:hypothetical protein
MPISILVVKAATTVSGQDVDFPEIQLPSRTFNPHG